MITAKFVSWNKITRSYVQNLTESVKRKSAVLKRFLITSRNSFAYIYPFHKRLVTTRNSSLRSYLLSTVCHMLWTVDKVKIDKDTGDTGWAINTSCFYIPHDVNRSCNEEVIFLKKFIIDELERDKTQCMDRCANFVLKERFNFGSWLFREGFFFFLRFHLLKKQDGLQSVRFNVACTENLLSFGNCQFWCR